MFTKFRVWDILEKKMKQVYGISCDKNGNIIGVKEDYAEEGEIYVHYDIKNYKFMQSIGLKDVNNNDVYVGDIIDIYLTVNTMDAETGEEITSEINYKNLAVVNEKYLTDGNNEPYTFSVKLDGEYIPLGWLGGKYHQNSVVIKGNVYEDKHLLEEVN